MRRNKRYEKFVYNVCKENIGKKGFNAKDYAFLHPGGQLGRKLMIDVESVMRKGANNPIIGKDKTVKDAMHIVTKAKAGAITVVDENNRLLGIFTDGDLRRHYSDCKNLADMQIGDVMTKEPVCILKNKLAVEALRIMQDKKIDELPVIDDNGLIVGMIDVQDLLKVGIV